MRRLAAIAIVAAACAAARPAIAQESVTGDFTDTYYPAHYRVSLNGVTVNEHALVYVTDDGTVYVSAADLDAWGLKRPLHAELERDGQAYYGLQSELHLAASYDDGEDALVIVAGKSAFRGQPASRAPSAAIQRGAFLNYDLTKETSKYDLTSVTPGGQLQMRYLSTANDGLEFHRGRMRWLHVNPQHHYVVSVGEATADGGWLGVNTPFAGVHYATDYTSDPEFVAHTPPSVSGFATSPSQLEVYIDNILELRRDVPQGPFTVRDLPQSAARADIVLVLTDQSGKRTTQVVRPTYESGVLGARYSEFSIDAGIGHENAGLQHQYYRGGVAQGRFRYGITDHLTAEVYGETINGANFADMGFDLSLGPSHMLGVRLGRGNRRHASEYRYELQHGKLRIYEDLRLDSAAQEPLAGLDFGDVDANITEKTQFAWALSRQWSVSADFNRFRSNTGSNTETLSSKIVNRAGRFITTLAPFYDFARHRTSANVGFVFQFTSNHRVGIDTSLTASGKTGSALDWRKTSSPDDPLSMRVKLSANRTQDRRAEISDELPWANASFVWQQQFGRNLYEPSIQGALAFVGLHAYPTATIGEKESIGVLHLPGYRNVRITVNSEDAGTTDSSGTAVLRKLSTYRDNIVAITTSDLPISVNVASPVHIVPPIAAPVDIPITVLSQGGFSMRVVDEAGTPLLSGSALSTATAQYPVGYDGHVFIPGVQTGTLSLSGRTARGACTVTVTVPASIAQIPDIGTQVCRR